MTAVMRTIRMTGAESFWYILGCISFGGMYFAKVPVKKALSEVGLVQMTSAEQFWYVLQCIAFGAGYFAKLPAKKALSEVGVAGYAPAVQPGAAAQLDPGYNTTAPELRGQDPATALPDPGSYVRHTDQ